MTEYYPQIAQAHPQGTAYHPFRNENLQVRKEKKDDEGAEKGNRPFVSASLCLDRLCY